METGKREKYIGALEEEIKSHLPPNLSDSFSEQI
jgi:hypothetical protein